MKHIQARISDAEFKQFKNKAIDLSITMEELIKLSLTEKIEREENNEATVKTCKKVLST